MSSSNLFGLILLILGVFLVGYGLRASQTITNKVVGGLTGHYTNRTMWCLIGGAVLILGGAALMFLWESGHPAPIAQPY